ncbi:MAG: hypothetical protein M1504_01085 [Candidatus Marsarchaeota archaeon]|nr:hypothetical protein [Candidatus Marsarchaeota archaeon]
MANAKQDRCIMCGELRHGLKVKEDFVIIAVRWIKRNITKNEKGYSLVVCKECYVNYDKAKRTFIKRQILYVAIGVIFAALITIGSTDKFLAVLYSILVILFMYMLSLLTYVPSVEMPNMGQSKSLKNGKNSARRRP